MPLSISCRREGRSQLVNLKSRCMGALAVMLVGICFAKDLPAQMSANLSPQSDAASSATLSPDLSASGAAFSPGAGIASAGGGTSHRRTQSFSSASEVGLTSAAAMRHAEQGMKEGVNPTAFVSAGLSHAPRHLPASSSAAHFNPTAPRLLSPLAARSPASSWIQPLSAPSSAGIAHPPVWGHQAGSSTLYSRMMRYERGGEPVRAPGSSLKHGGIKPGGILPEGLSHESPLAPK